MNEYRGYSCLKGLFMCKRVTKMLGFGLILLVVCVCFFSDTMVFAGQSFMVSDGASMRTLTSRKIKKITIRAGNHQEFMKVRAGIEEDDVLYDQDNPDYAVQWTVMVRSQPIGGIKTNRFQRISYYHPRIGYRSIIRC